MSFVVVIGAGPAGLMAAEVLVSRGHKVLVADQKPSFGRKLLMAGKSGLNLTKSESTSTLLKSYGSAAEALRPMVTDFGPEQIQQWAVELKQTLFTGTTKRVFPTAMKASPLLRSWLNRLGESGVERQTRWRWIGWNGSDLRFETPEGEITQKADAVILALGGASWSKLGSDGLWSKVLNKAEVSLSKFEPSNVGVTIPWTSHMEKYFGTPLKNIALTAGKLTTRGEAVITKTGLEGGGVYAVSSEIRDGHVLTLDLLPDIELSELADKLEKDRGKTSVSNFLRKAARLEASKQALLREFEGTLPQTGKELAKLIKNLPIRTVGLRPIDEAISTAGGVSWDGVDETLMLRKRPGVFVAGEMLDWEAPTGGYLLTACFATGRWAGQKADAWLSVNDG